MAKRKAKFVELWERQPGESPKAFAAFCAYRDMNPYLRTQQRVATEKNISLSSIANWSVVHDWMKRVEAWDDEMDRQAVARYHEEIDKMHERHIQVSQKVMDKVEEAIDNLNAEDVKPSDIARLIEVAAKLERLSRGDSGEAVEVRDGGKAVNPVTFVMPSNGRDEDREDEGE